MGFMRDVKRNRFVAPSDMDLSSSLGKTWPGTAEAVRKSSVMQLSGVGAPAVSFLSSESEQNF